MRNLQTASCEGSSGSDGSFRVSLIGPSIRVSGVRNSWLTFEKNVVLTRSISARLSARSLSISNARALAAAVATAAARRSTNTR